MLKLSKELPKIGENIERFIEVFGSPTKGSSMILYLFEIEGIRPLLQCSTTDGRVTNISWSLPYEVEQVREIALRFLPSDAYLVNEGVFEVSPLLNADVPIKEDLYKYIDEDLFFGVGEDSTFTIHLDTVNK